MPWSGGKVSLETWPMFWNKLLRLRVIWMSRPMLVDELEAKHDIDGLGRKRWPCWPVVVLVVADQAIWDEVLSSHHHAARIYPLSLSHTHTRHDLTKGIFQVKSQKKTLVISACRVLDSIRIPSWILWIFHAGLCLHLVYSLGCKLFAKWMALTVSVVCTTKC